MKYEVEIKITTDIPATKEQKESGESDPLMMRLINDQEHTGLDNDIKFLSKLGRYAAFELNRLIKNKELDKYERS